MVAERSSDQCKAQVCAYPIFRNEVLENQRLPRTCSAIVPIADRKVNPITHIPGAALKHREQIDIGPLFDLISRSVQKWIDESGELLASWFSVAVEKHS